MRNRVRPDISVRSLARPQRDLDPHLGAAQLPRLDDVSREGATVMRLGDATHEGEAEPRAPATPRPRRVAADERLEGALEEVGQEARSVVADDDAYGFTGQVLD